MTLAPRVEPPPGGVWTLLHLLRWSAQYLTDKGVPEPRLQTELLLAHCLGLARLDLYLQYDRPLDTSELGRFRPLLQRRARREPLQYITGLTAFRELVLETDARALIPRPETEGLVEEVLAWSRVQPSAVGTVLEVGTGSGAIALSLWSESDPPLRKMVATDLSSEALCLAQNNAARLGLEAAIDWRLGDGLAPIVDEEVFDILVSNPPYVGERESAQLAPEVSAFEPRLALFSGEDGLGLIRRLIEAGSRVLRPGGLLALEIGADQGGPVQELASEQGDWSEIRVARDLSGRDRYLLAASRAPGRSESARGRP